MAKVNIQLINGTITEVIEDSYMHEGCPTCDFGKAYIKELYFVVEVNGYDKPQIVKLVSRDEEKYSDSLSVGNVIMLMAKVIENDVDFEGFLYLCRTKLNKKGDIEMTVSEYWGF